MSGALRKGENKIIDRLLFLPMNLFFLFSFAIVAVFTFVNAGFLTDIACRDIDSVLLIHRYQALEYAKEGLGCKNDTVLKIMIFIFVPFVIYLFLTTIYMLTNRKVVIHKLSNNQYILILFIILLFSYTVFFADFDLRNERLTNSYSGLFNSEFIIFISSTYFPFLSAFVVQIVAIIFRAVRRNGGNDDGTAIQ